MADERLAGFTFVFVIFLSLFVSLCSSATPVVPSDISDPLTPGGRCCSFSKRDWNGTIAEGCRSLVNYDTFFCDDYNTLRTQIGADLAPLLLATGPCYDNIVRSTCVGLLRPCFEVPVPNSSLTIAVPQFLCRPLCQATYDTCLPYAVNILGLDPTLTAAQLTCVPPFYEPVYGKPKYPIFPNGSYTIQLPLAPGSNETFNATFPCYDNRSLTNLTASGALACPVGTHNVDLFTCQFDCPQPLISSGEYEEIEIMVSVMGWISFVSMAILSISYVVDPTKRVFPANLPLFFFISVMGLSFAFCLGSMVGHEDVWCKNDQESWSFGGPACTIQGIFYVYFTLASAAWWLTISFNLFLLVVCGVDLKHIFTVNGYIIRLKWILQPVYHFCCFGLPALPVIISLASETLGYSGRDVWCTIHSDNSVNIRRGMNGADVSGNSGVDYWNLFLLTLPVLVIVCIGILFLVLVLTLGFWQSKQGWKYFFNQWRLFAFFFLYVWIYSFVFSWQIYFISSVNEQQEAYATYVTCLAKQAVFQVSCTVDGVINYPLWFIVTFNVTAQGFFVFLIFGTSWSLLKGWYRFIMTLLQISHLVASDETTKGSGSSSDSWRKALARRLPFSASFSNVEDTVGSPDDEELSNMERTSDSNSNSNSNNEEDDGTDQHSNSDREDAPSSSSGVNVETDSDDAAPSDSEAEEGDD